MEEKYLCTCRNITYKEHDKTILHPFSLSVGHQKIIALIGDGEAATCILQLIAGVKTADTAKICYSLCAEQEKIQLSEKIQYAPDDIVCYPNLTVKQFFHAVSKGDEVQREAERLLACFDIDEKEELLNLTFEQNRLVGLIQTLMVKPELLLLDKPYDMLREDTYKNLLRQMVQLYKEGSSILITAEHYEDVVTPCSEYLFLRDGQLVKRFGRKEIPKLLKVITIWGGKKIFLQKEKIKETYSKETCVRYLYQEEDMQELALRLRKCECTNFHVEEVSMEEQVFEEFTRWQL